MQAHDHTTVTLSHSNHGQFNQNVSQQNCQLLQALSTRAMADGPGASSLPQAELVFLPACPALLPLAFPHLTLCSLRSRWLYSGGMSREMKRYRLLHSSGPFLYSCSLAAASLQF